jgi:hypothetical protein
MEIKKNIELFNIIDKFKKAKLDKAGLVNNTVLFVLAYLGVFYLFQIFTIIPAFSIGVKMMIYNSEIDFNAVNTAASDADLWTSADNVINIFGTPVMMTIVVVLSAFLFLIKWDSERLNMRRLLFWIILCGVVRINGNYIFGHMFNLWNCNLVTDFLKITYPSIVLRWIFIILAFAIIFTVFRAMSVPIKKLFNPFAANRVNNLLSNIFFPVLFGSIFLVLWFIPRETKNESYSLILFLFATSFSLCRPFLKRYRGIAEEIEATDDEQVNKVPIIILACLLPLKIFLDRGFFLETSPYRSFFIENTMTILIILVVSLTLLISIRVYKKRQRAAELKYLKEKEEIDKISSKLDDNQWGFHVPKDMDKYKKNWDDANDI